MARIIRGLLIGALVSLALAAQAAPPPPPAGPVRQQFIFRVIDWRDRPVAGARISITSLAGWPERKGPLVTDEFGEAILVWKPEVISETVGIRSKDVVFHYISRLRYMVEAKGHAVQTGFLKKNFHQQRVHSKGLETLARSKPPGPLSQLVVLHAHNALFKGHLRKQPTSDPLKARLARFRSQRLTLFQRLGSGFAWPAFAQKKRELQIYFDWQGASWVGLAQAPLLAQVTMASGLPIALACGGDLLPLKGINGLSLIFQIKVTPPDDPWALPKTIKVVLKAPAKDYQALARGTLSADDFLNRHPPRQIGKLPKMTKKTQPVPPVKKTKPGAEDGVALQPKKESTAGAGGAGAPQKHGGVPASGGAGD